MPTDTPLDSHARAPDGAAPRRRVEDAGRILGALRSIVRELRLASREAEQRAGVHGAPLQALRQLADNPAITLAELADRTHTDASSASVAVSRLVEQGLVVRRRADGDRRRLSLALTACGRAAARQAPDTEAARLAGAAVVLGDRELHTLAAGLSKLIAGLGERDD